MPALQVTSVSATQQIDDWTTYAQSLIPIHVTGRPFIYSATSTCRTAIRCSRTEQGVFGTPGGPAGLLTNSGQEVDLNLLADALH